MPEGQDIRRIGGRLVAVQSDIAGITEGNHKLAQLWHIRKRSTDVGRGFQKQKVPLDGLAGPSGGFRGFGNQEPPASLQSPRCAFRNDYLWHSGTALSSPVPHVFNQARTSWPVRCRPVS